jgi:hypothetical protein
MTAPDGNGIKTWIVFCHGVSPTAKNSEGSRYGINSESPSLANLFLVPTPVLQRLQAEKQIGANAEPYADE